MLVSPTEVLQLIPQRAPIIMVDGLLEHRDESSLSYFEILPTNIFVENNQLQLPGLVENIAQTCALRSGYHFRQQVIKTPNAAPSKPPIGFIGEVKNLVVYELPAVGSTLQTRVTLLHHVFTASVVMGEIHCQGQLVAACEMKIFLAPE